MSDNTTAAVIAQFNDAFTRHDPALLTGLVADDCVMVSVQPAPEGARYEGLDACLGFWQDLAADENTSFAPDDVYVFGDRAVIKWHVTFKHGEVNEVFGDAHASSTSVAGVNLMQIRDGRIVEALGYSKTP
ncbi:nuclear transport factor 2 family protein [Actinocrispum wychmicini]|uniref:Ketosteroid isomerase-like protein n=1 Tax=Actinocrispum wychmicini TaxID=1213861 RepID=A0A4R2JRC0_9PSEU|nr:nuclear transport factor 2 family protein [Actinocrispum wychmicini]TCO62803.1 ketosteroid isomerase-like protein [Actinocrispum wychmicini]